MNLEEMLRRAGWRCTSAEFEEQDALWQGKFTQSKNDTTHSDPKRPSKRQRSANTSPDREKPSKRRENASTASDPDSVEEQVRRYFDKVRESEGFDVDGVELPPEFHWPGLINRVKLPSRGKVYDEYFDMARNSLKWYNSKEDCEFKPLKVEKVNRQGCAGFINYITLTAKDATDSPVTFQAKYWEGIGFYEVLSCKPVKGNRKST